MATRKRPDVEQAGDPRVERPRVPAASRRLATALDDFLLDPAERLTEQEQALMNAMLYGLVERLADEIRVRLPDALAAATECSPAKVVRKLSQGGLLAKPALIELLLRRADMLRLGEEASGGAEGHQTPLLQRWVADAVAEVAAAAMAVALSRNAARDRFGRPALELADCPAEIAVELAYEVAAVLAWRCGGHDEELVAAAVDLLARHDEGQGLDALEGRLVRALHAAQRLDPATLLALAAAGEVSLLAEALARLAGIPGATAWALLVDGQDGRLALLLRMAEQPRTLAAALLARLADPLGLPDPVGELEWFDQIGGSEAERARARLRLPPHYQHAAAALEGHGHPLA